MIRLGPNYSFRYAAAAGALGFDGRCYWWEKPLRWLGFIDPSLFLVISKTLTAEPRKGNYRWWKPWQTVRLVPGGAVNAMGLPNPGLSKWFREYYKNTHKYNIAVSIAPNTLHEADDMAWRIQSGGCENIRAIELNCSCPNLGHEATEDHICRMALEVAAKGVPTIVKLGYQQPFLSICKRLDGKVAAFDLINTVPWSKTSAFEPSPLAKYGLEGGVSGWKIAWYAYEAMRTVKDAGIKTPVLSGGGIMNYEQASLRLAAGADAISFGTIFLRHPCRASSIVRRLEREIR